MRWSPTIFVTKGFFYVEAFGIGYFPAGYGCAPEHGADVDVDF
jgi:hypothetical protein